MSDRYTTLRWGILGPGSIANRFTESIALLHDRYACAGYVRFSAWIHFVRCQAHAVDDERAMSGAFNSPFRTAVAHHVLDLEREGHIGDREANRRGLGLLEALLRYEPFPD